MLQILKVNDSMNGSTEPTINASTALGMKENEC